MYLSIGLLAIAVGMAAPIEGMAPTQPIAMERSETHADRQLSVSSTSFQQGGAIPQRYSAYGDNVSPQLKWSPVAGAKSYALVVEDPDAKSPAPVLHWIAWNIPATVTSLPEGLRDVDAGSLMQGTNTHGTKGYSGPHPPIGDAPHHYHFQVFALDRMLAAAAGENRDAFLAGASGHVVAKGELVVTYQQAIKPDQ